MTVVGHQGPRPVQAYLLDVLNRRRIRDLLEGLVKHGRTHSRQSGQRIRAEWPGVVGVDVPQDARNLCEVIVSICQGPKRIALLAAQDAIQDFANKLATEHATVQGGAEAFQESDDRVA